MYIREINTLLGNYDPSMKVLNMEDSLSKLVKQRMIY